MHDRLLCTRIECRPVSNCEGWTELMERCNARMYVDVLGVRGYLGRFHQDVLSRAHPPGCVAVNGSGTKGAHLVRARFSSSFRSLVILSSKNFSHPAHGRSATQSVFCFVLVCCNIQNVAPRHHLDMMQSPATCAQ